MAIEVFTQVNEHGVARKKGPGDNLLVGTGGDYRTLARWIMDGFEAGRRKPSMKVLADRVASAAPVAHHIRLTVRESRLLLEALERKKRSPSRSPAATRLLTKLEACMLMEG